ncbi:hypothetical protein JN535_16820 [Cellulosimicrobium cellulans]|uniref:hypothetical protein n=1 Tax=Cellulosimicrobium cellulans TaxID=1710 RepID=UPI0019655325|nr:hypothetical protein [Cellulosimicrobium cellulans]MBN0041826.1 hypothetical protein [Cellulosimicrobium cellulans]
MSESQPEGGRGTGEEQDWRGEDEAVQGAPDIGTAGAFPALANDSLPKDPDVPTDVDPGDERSWSGDDVDDPGADPRAGASGTGG